ncbi:MAG: hypothetical protein WBA43_25155, partial [Elainellaceae cyanobacterium]
WNTDQGSNEIAVMVAWLPYENQDYILMNFLEAMKSFIFNKNNELVLYANMTLESILSQICFLEFSKGKNAKDVEEFLVSGATYGHQINHLFNLICKSNGFPTLGQPLLARINKIRKLRNQIAHKGILKNKKGIVRDLEKDEKDEIMTTCIVGYAFFRDILEKMDVAEV